MLNKSVRALAVQKEKAFKAIVQKEIGEIDTLAEFRKVLAYVYGEKIELCGFPCDLVKAFERANPQKFAQLYRGWLKEELATSADMIMIRGRVVLRPDAERFVGINRILKVVRNG